MRNHPVQLATLALLLCLSSMQASVLYVNLNSTNPTPPYSDWTTAATNIQDAVDAALAGDTVLVTNGIYATGGRAWFDSGSNRVTLTNAIRLQSFNGPAFTFIVGRQVPGTTFTSISNRVRCVGMGNGAVLSGFTLTNGEAGGGNYIYGGGVANLTSGAACTVSNCVLIGNLATNSFGGGADGVQLFNSQIIGNSGEFGGGANGCVLINCLIASNTATSGGGGVYGVHTTGNSFLTNCTIVGNSASGTGGGAYGCTLANSIIYYNSNAAAPDCYQCTLNNCCTPMLVPANINCISNPPDFVDLANGNFRLQMGSPCIDAGSNALTSGTVDLDGDPRIAGATVDMGAYENQNTNPVHYVSLTSTSPIAPFTNWLTAATNIQDAIDAANAGDFVIVSNGIYNSGFRTIYGSASNRVAITMPVTVQSFNGPAATTIMGFASPAASPAHFIRCAYLTNGASLIGFTLLNGGSRSSGDAIAEQSGGCVWCESSSAVISNCIISIGSATQYGGGAFRGTLLNCTVTSNSAAYGGGAASNILVNVILIGNRSGALTSNYGGGVYGSALSNCLVVANESLGSAGTGGGVALSTLSSCVVSNNSAPSGGGLYLCVADHCLISSNTASYGGGALSNALNNCILRNNFASQGGGALECNLTNCTAVSNTAASGAFVGSGGAVYGGSAVNCILYYNSGVQGPNFYFPSNTVLNYCCTTPMPTNGMGNITNDPVLANPFAEDFHLQSTSPCINSGNNACVTSSTDYDGNPRIVGGTVDIGAYEYQTPTSILSYAWAQQYGLPTDGSADFADPDGDGMNNWQEWIAGLNPLDPASVLLLQSPQTNSSPAGIAVSWLSVSNRTYYLQQATNLAAQPAFSTVQSNIAGQVGTTSFIDTTATNGGPYFYRVGVQH